MPVYCDKCYWYWEGDTKDYCEHPDNRSKSVSYRKEYNLNEKNPSELNKDNNCANHRGYFLINYFSMGGVKYFLVLLFAVLLFVILFCEGKQ